MLRNQRTHQKRKLVRKKLRLIQQRGPVLRNQRTHQKIKLVRKKLRLPQ